MESYIYKISFVDSEDGDDHIFYITFDDTDTITESIFIDNKRINKGIYDFNTWYLSFDHSGTLYKSIDILLEEDLLLELL